LWDSTKSKVMIATTSPRTSLETSLEPNSFLPELSSMNKKESSQEFGFFRDADDHEIAKPSTPSSFLPQSPFSSDDAGEEDGFFIECEDDELPGRPADFQNKEEPAIVSPPFPIKSILKSSVDENIPICTKKKSWSKLPAPDLEYVYMKRVESMNSFFHLDSLDDSSSSQRPIKKVNSKVNFELVTVREYQQTIGDNPSVSYGTPISLDWEYEENEPLDLDLYEAARGGRRTVRQLFLNHYRRKNTLIHKFGYSEEEVKAGKHRTNKVRSQREVSKILQLSFRPLILLEEMRESIVRKCKRKTESKPQQEQSSSLAGKRSQSSVSF
jgi:hypothetical protein